jgi:hypothetical protein
MVVIPKPGKSLLANAMYQNQQVLEHPLSRGVQANRLMRSRFKSKTSRSPQEISLRSSMASMKRSRGSPSVHST